MTLKWHYEDNESIKNNVANLAMEAVKELSETPETDREILFERITGVMYLADKIKLSNDLDQYQREEERKKEAAERKAREEAEAAKREAEKNAAGA